MKLKLFSSRMIVASCALLAMAQWTASAATLVSRYSFSETSGTTAHDSVGGYNATLNGASTFSGSGQVALDGTAGTYVSLPGTQLSGLTAATFDAWFSFTVPNNNVHLFSIDDGGGFGGNYLRFNVYDTGNGGTNFLESNGSPVNKLMGDQVLPQNQLIHVSVVYDPGNNFEAIYYNGVLESSFTGTLESLASIPQTLFSLGKSPWSGYGDPYLVGSISEFRVYSGALSATEIAANDSAGPDSIPVIGVGIPQISPTNNLYVGETAVLSCGVSGPVSGYHWEFDNGSSGATFTPIAGATSLTYTQDTTSLLGNYEYRFIATNSLSSSTSSIVTLTVNAASAPVISSDTSPSSATCYTGGSVTFTAAFTGNHPITNQWQVSTDGGTTWVGLTAQTNTTLTLTNLQLSDAGLYRLAATNAIGNNASTPATLTVNDISTAKYQWAAPVAFNGLNADQILTNVTVSIAGVQTNVTGSIVGAAAFGSTAYQVTLGNGRILNFTTDGSIATATGGGTATGAYPAGTGLSTSNANFNSVLNGFSWDGGPKIINVNNLIAGQQYSVQFFAVDDRNDASESNRLANFQDPFDGNDVSTTFKMGDNVYVVGVFTAANTTESIQMNLPTGNAGNINAVVVRALSFTPVNQPPTITTAPTAQSAFTGHPARFTVAADSYVLPTYQWQAGPAGGPFTNLVDGGIFIGATSNVLTLTNVTAYDSVQFQVVVSNPAGSVTGGPVALTVLPVPPTSGAASQAVKSLSPVAYWPLNETNDPSTGTAAVYDAAGVNDGLYLAAAQNAFNGIIGVQPSDGYGIFATNQGALKTSGNTDQSWVTTPPLNLNTNTVTIGMWIYPDGLQANAVGLYVNRNSGTVAGIGYYNNDRLGYKWNNDGSATWSFNSGLLIPTNIWSYVAVVVEPARATLYLYNTNGMLSATNFTTHTNMTWGGSQANIRIGCDNSVATTFNGKIDEVAVFNRALAASEIVQLAGTLTVKIVPSGNALQLSWPYGTLLEATSITGPWTTNSNTSPYLVSPIGAQKFYRIQAP